MHVSGSVRGHPLTIPDNHSRYALGLAACPNQRTATVRAHLISAFQRYGLPDRLLVDNGSPWGNHPAHPYTPLTVWLRRLGIAVSHSRPYHPQTLGKDERFHGTLQRDLARQPLSGQPQALPSATAAAARHGPDDRLRRVQMGGWVSFRGRQLRLPKALRGQPVAFRPTPTDGCWEIRFLTDDLGTLDLREPA